MRDGGLGGVDITDGAIGSAKLADGTVTGADVADASIGVEDLKPGLGARTATAQVSFATDAL